MLRRMASERSPLPLASGGRKPRTVRSMEVKTAVLADTANVSQEGKLNIIGIFNRIFSKEFPATHPVMSFVVRLEAHQSEAGEHTMQVTIANEDGRKIAEIKVDFTLGKAVNAALPIGGNIIIPIQGAQFPAEGVYSFDIFIDGRYEESARLVLEKWLR